MERYTEESITIDDLIGFVHNNLSNEKLDAIEHFLLKSDLYADLTDNLIDIISDYNFSLSETKQYLAIQSNLSPTTKLETIFFEVLEKKYNTMKQGVDDFKQQIMSWFLPIPPLEYGVVLMSSNLKVIKPANEVSYEKSIQFELEKPIQDSDELIVHIFESGNEKPVVGLTFSGPIQQFTVDIEAQKMHPGVYYWRLQLIESGEKAEGSFYVKPIFDIFR